jgi:hypothetical protein
MSETDGTVNGVTKIVDRGLDSERWNLVVLGDGYRDDELAQYQMDVDTVWRAIETTAPFDDWLDAINVHRVDVASAESGAGDPATGDGPRTYFDATFGTVWNGEPLDRLLTVDDDLARITAQDLVPEAHQILVIVNSSKYGGSGGPDVAVCSMGEQATEIAIHEIGHSGFKLADEYDYGRGLHASGPEPSERNVTRDSQASSKWGDMVPAGTPLPTETNPGATAPAVGTYEGAKYVKRGMYRPSPTCYMNDFAPFCAVCTAQIENTLRFYAPSDGEDRNRRGVPQVTEWQLDDTAKKIDPLTTVTLMGWLRDAKGGKYNLVIDPWCDELVTIDANDIVDQIPGSNRPDGRSVIWVARGAEIVQKRHWIAGDFAAREAEAARGGSGLGTDPAPPGDKKPPG